MEEVKKRLTEKYSGKVLTAGTIIDIIMDAIQMSKEQSALWVTDVRTPSAICDVSSPHMGCVKQGLVDDQIYQKQKQIEQ